MGLAGLKEDSVAYVIFEGPNENYPKWFSSSVMAEVYVDDFGFTILPYGDTLQSVKGDIYLDSLVEGDDTFLLNSRGDMFRTSVDNFDFSYERIDDRYAVIKGREVE